jgi:EAL domain-containing protein (putative c-di-GMP-specific phosphodiesterase class I)
MIDKQLRQEIGRPFIIIQVDNNRFWIIMPLTELAHDIERVIKVLKGIQNIHGEPVYIEYSVGAHQTDKREDCEKMATFIYSDSAARIATESRIPYVIYQDEMALKRKHYELLMHIQNSFEQQDFFLVFQPQIRFKDNAIEGLEALIRWRHPTRGIILPGDFIPLVEKTRLIGELTMYVFRHAIQALKHLTSAGYKIPISVNVSAKNLYDPLFFEKTFELITVHEIDPSLIRIEVTESTVMENPELSAEVLKKFAGHGIQIIIDDFGTGYSSLSYLSRYPVNTIKIDRYFIKNINQNPSIHKIVSATVKLAHDLGYEVLAEGVETDLVRQLVVVDEFDSAQGFLFAKPLDIDKLIEYLRQQKENPTA